MMSHTSYHRGSTKLCKNIFKGYHFIFTVKHLCRVQLNVTKPSNDKYHAEVLLCLESILSYAYIFVSHIHCVKVKVAILEGIATNRKSSLSHYTYANIKDMVAATVGK